MKFYARIAWVAGVTALVLHTVSVVQAQTVPVLDSPEVVTPAPTIPETLPPTEEPVLTADSTEVGPAEAAPPVPTMPESLPPTEEPVLTADSTEAAPPVPTMPETLPPTEEPVLAADSTEAAPPAPTSLKSLSPTEEAVTFTDINDAVPGKYFDAATTAPDPLNPNRLIIGFNTGFDSATWTNNTFTASTAAFHRSSAMDTISFLIEAPAGFYISKITYTQSGNGSTSRTGLVAGSANWVVDYVSDEIGRFGKNATLSRTMDLTDQHKTIIPVSITNSTFAFATPQLGAATLQVTRAEVLVELLPLEP